MESDSIPIGEAAARLSLSAWTVRQMIATGKLRCWRTPGGHRRIDVEDLAAARRALREPELLRERKSVLTDAPARTLGRNGADTPTSD